MDSFIRELYYGNVNPQDRRYDLNSTYAEAMQRLTDNKKKLIDTLGGEEKKLFLDYTDAWSKVLDESVTETFVDSFRMGALFAVDTFASSENVFKPIDDGMF